MGPEAEFIELIDPLTFDQAEAHCKSINRVLAYPLDSEHHNRILNARSRSGEAAYYWLGIQIRDNKDWRNVEDNSIQNFYNWRSQYGEPSSKQPDGTWKEQCVNMYPDGTMNDLDCQRTMHFLCQKKYVKDPIAPLADMTDSFKQKVEEHFKDTVFAKNVNEPVIKIRDRIIRSYNKFDCSKEVSPQRRRRESPEICDELNETLADVLEWIKIHLATCKDPEGKAGKHSVSYKTKFGDIKKRMEKCPRKLKKLNKN